MKILVCMNILGRFDEPYLRTSPKMSNDTYKICPRNFINETGHWVQNIYLVPWYNGKYVFKLLHVLSNPYWGAPIAQLGKRRTLHRKVAGSIHTRGAVLCP